MTAIFTRAIAPSRPLATAHPLQAAVVRPRSGRRARWWRRASFLLAPLAAAGITGSVMMTSHGAAPGRRAERGQVVHAAMPAPVAPAPAAVPATLVAGGVATPIAPAVLVAEDGAPPARHAARSSRRRAVAPVAASGGQVCLRSRACVRDAELAADRRLRDAYAEAVAAGAPREDLAEFRAAWADVRRHAADRPLELAASYTVMARQLRGLARETRDDRY